MSKRNIHIENLQIRLRGIAPETARTAVGGLGHELLGQLTTPDKVTNSDRTAAGELRQRIAKQIVGSIETKMVNGGVATEGHPYKNSG